MKIQQLAKWACVALITLNSYSARANSIGLDINYDPFPQVTINVLYDFTDFAMFGGGANLVYDPTVLEFVSYTQAELADDAQFAASPIGQFENPGLYSGFGIGTFEFFNGMNSAGTIGVFVFEINNNVDQTDFNSCGETPDFFSLSGLVCVTPNAINPFVSLAGESVNEEIFTGPGAYIPPHQVPVPAALWFLMSAVGLIAGIQKKR